MIAVTNTRGERDTFPTATGWHVDENGDLHIRKTRGNVATFARHLWASVAEVESDLEVRVEFDGEAIVQAIKRRNKRKGIDGAGI